MICAPNSNPIVEETVHTIVCHDERRRTLSKIQVTEQPVDSVVGKFTQSTIQFVDPCNQLNGLSMSSLAGSH